MVPERKTIDPAVIATQQELFNARSQQFGQIYSRGQNFLSTGTDIIRRITGRPTHQQELSSAISNLTETRLNLAEARARMAVQGIMDNITYREQLAINFAHQYIATGQEVLAAARVENTNIGLLDGLYRANMNPFGAAIRLASGGILGFVGSEANFNDPNVAAAFVEAGIFLGLSGGLDTVRHLWLQTFDRSRFNLNRASTANLLRRRSSIQEGQITGDEVLGSVFINQELEGSLAGETLAQLELDGIQRPDFLNPNDLSDILRQRDSLRFRVQRYEDLTGLVRSRDISRVSRLTRTLLYTLLAAGLIQAQINRPEYCGEADYSNPDEKVAAFAGGLSNLSSLKGKAEADWFKRFSGRDFDHESPEDRELFDTVYNTDPEGNAEIVRRIAEEIKGKNPELRFATPDLFFHKDGKDFWEVCLGKQDTVYRIPIIRR